MTYPHPSGGKGDEYRPDKCNHAPDDGCEWCCRACNYDQHFCPGCGTVTDHKNHACDDCLKEIAAYENRKEMESGSPSNPDGSLRQ